MCGAVQALTVKTAVEDPETDSEQAVLLIERAKDSKAPATRAQYLLQALQRLTALPAVQPPKPAGVSLAAEIMTVFPLHLRARLYYLYS